MMSPEKRKFLLFGVGAFVLAFYIYKGSRKDQKSERQARLSRPWRWHMEQFLSAKSLLVGYILRSRMYRKFTLPSPMKKRDLEDNAECFYLSKHQRPEPYPVAENEAERFIGVHIGLLKSKEILDLVDVVRGILEAKFGKDVVFMHDPELHHITVYAFSRREENFSLDKVGRTVEEEMNIAGAVIEQYSPVRIYLQDVVLTSTGVVILLWNQSVRETTTNVDALRASLRASNPGGPVGQTQRIIHTTLARLVALRPLTNTSLSDLNQTREEIRACVQKYIGKLSFECQHVFYSVETTRLSHTGNFWSKKFGVKAPWRRLR